MRKVISILNCSMASPPSQVLDTAPAPRQERAAGISWAPVIWFFALILVCYAPVLGFLIEDWVDNEDMGHGFFVPVVAGYIAWAKREEFLATPAKPNYWALALVSYAAFQLLIGILGAELFLSRTALVLSLIGAVWLLNGTERLKVVAFPLFLLFFMIPLPAIIFNQITFPLQILASRIAETVLMLIGIPVLREGNVLELASQKLSVVEACSGIRSLLSLSFLSLVYGYFFETKNWVRVTLFIATVPIAMIANAGRVTITGILSEINTEYAEGVYHSAQGWIIFMIAMIMLVMAHQILSYVSRRFAR